MLSRGDFLIVMEKERQGFQRMELQRKVVKVGRYRERFLVLLKMLVGFRVGIWKLLLVDGLEDVYMGKVKGYFKVWYLSFQLFKERLFVEQGEEGKSRFE